MDDLDEDMPSAPSSEASDVESSALSTVLTTHLDLKIVYENKAISQFLVALNSIPDLAACIKRFAIQINEDVLFTPEAMGIMATLLEHERVRDYPRREILRTGIEGREKGPVALLLILPPNLKELTITYDWMDWEWNAPGHPRFEAPLHHIFELFEVGRFYPQYQLQCLTKLNIVRESPRGYMYLTAASLFGHPALREVTIQGFYLNGPFQPNSSHVTKLTVLPFKDRNHYITLSDPRFYAWGWKRLLSVFRGLGSNFNGIHVDPDLRGFNNFGCEAFSTHGATLASLGLTTFDLCRKADMQLVSRDILRGLDKIKQLTISSDILFELDPDTLPSVLHIQALNQLLPKSVVGLRVQTMGKTPEGQTAWRETWNKLRTTHRTECSQLPSVRT